MDIKVNGEAKSITEGMNIAQLLTENNVDNPEMVSVQLNGEFVDKDAYESTTLATGSEVDFLYFMGGGSN